jgi:hypothetical protein
VSFLIHGEVCFGQKKEAVSMDTKMSEIEDAWNRGDRTKYYSSAATIAKEIKVNPVKTNLVPASKLLGSLLSKQANPTEVGISDLSTMQDLASYLASHDDVSIDDRRQTLGLLCKYLGKLRKERLPNFTPKPVDANVAPPPGVPGFAGMGPDAIKDPAAKAKYEQAIHENEDNARRNARQHQLKVGEWAMRKKLKSYMLKTFQAGDISSPAFIQCTNDAGLDNEERKEIGSQLKETKH